MQRVTKRNSNGQYYMDGDGIFSDWGTPEKFMGDDVDTIGAIEDILGDNYDFDRLRVLVEADRDGRCVVLPCKIGSLVYSHARKLDGQDYMKETEFWWSDIPELGKTVFLNPEAAEAALRGEQDG